MELSGVVSRSIPCLPSEAGAVSSSARPRSGLLCGQRGGFCGVSMRFRDEGHVKYYSEGARCGGKVDKAVEKNAKKKLKLVKGLYKELSMFSQMGFGIEEGSELVGESQGNQISEAAEVLLTRLKQLKSEGKELKKRRNLEKARLKDEKMKHLMDSKSSSSSSSSSESSDSETDEVIDLNRLRMESPAQKQFEQPQPINQGTAMLSMPSISKLSTIENSSSPSNKGNETDRKIEVCMGGKCRKSGGAALLDELQKAVGIKGAVVSCKCMGKCKDGPNVRFCNGAVAQREREGDSAVNVSPSPQNPLCIGVGLEDVGVIVANFLGTDQNGLDVGFWPAP